MSIRNWPPGRDIVDPANAALFATAETGDLGRFLGTDPSYSQYDEPIIANLGLPFMAVFSGSEPATVAELDTRVAANEPILMYWWTPTAAVAKYDLVQVELPEYSEECYAGEVSEVDCAYPSDTLVKLASAQLAEKAPERVGVPRGLHSDQRGSAGDAPRGRDRR